MLTKRNNPTVKAVSVACFEAVKKSAKLYGTNSPEYKRAVFEYELAVRSSDSKPDAFGVIKYRNMNFGEICELFSRRYGGHTGATKRTHDCHPDGWTLQFFVVKRYKWHGHEFWGEGCGNQLIDEIECWLKMQDTPDADFLCPIFKYETAKSDKCKPLSDTMKERVCIIAQKAVHVSNMREACEEAERRNRREGFHGVTAEKRISQLKDLARRMHWRDVEWNGGNSGVIFDYSQNCYKAVFIDYAL